MKIIKCLKGGGSSAKTYLVEDDYGRTVVLKSANWEGIGSNGTPWLKAQFIRLKQFKKVLSPLGASKIPEVYEYSENDNGAYYTLEYLQGGKPLSLYYYENPDKGTDTFLKDINKLLTIMSEQFYSLGKLRLPIDYIERTYLSRLDYRLGLLCKKEGAIYERLVKNKYIKFDNESLYKLDTLFNNIYNTDIISINNQEYLNINILLAKLRKDSRLLKRITPSFLPKFAHGDGLLRNFMKMPDNSIKLFDIRGIELPKNLPIPSIIDIPFELGKFLHGILLEIVRNDSFTLTMAKVNNSFKFMLNYNLDNKSVTDFLEVRRKMPLLFKHHKALNNVINKEPEWLQKAFFAEATHFLADAVNRLENDPTCKHAVAYYLIGTILFNNYLNDCAE